MRGVLGAYHKRIKRRLRACRRVVGYLLVIVLRYRYLRKSFTLMSWEPDLKGSGFHTFARNVTAATASISLLPGYFRINGS